MSLIGRLGFQPHDDVDADVVGGLRGRASGDGLGRGGADGRASEDMISEERMPVRLGAGLQGGEASLRRTLRFFTPLREYTCV